ncbi:MAG: ATP-binding protein, partial [Syntrophales bacterium]|nr:ATP-binding protein [Syntrophales bacterium]
AAIEAIKQAADLSRRLITFAKGGGPVRRPCDVGELVNDVFQRSVTGIKAKPVEKKCFTAEDLREALVDEGQVRQVVRNMVVNAMEAMPNGGMLKVTAENYRVSNRDSLPVPEGDYVRITVEDTGSGISGDKLRHVFDPYFSTKQMGSQKGMGLGLSVCHSIVAMHGGCITVESVPGEGTAFHVYLPAIGDRDESSPKMKQKKKQLFRKKILVMDDVAQIRDMIGKLLNAMGFQVEVAADGAEALDLYTKAIATGEAFDMVILDLTIKNGMGGIETIEQLVRIDPQVKAIILSGYSNDPAIENYSDYGFMGALKKPFRREELENVMYKIL